MNRTRLVNYLKQEVCLSVVKRASVMLVSLLLITGCSSTVETVTKVAEVIYDSDTQVGSNETQSSELSISALTVNVDTTVSNTKKRSFFSSKARKGYYLFRIYQIGPKNLKRTENGVLNANQVLKIMQGEYLAQHQFYLKRDGYRFIKHFKVDEKVGALFAVVNFEEPQCSVWSTLNVIKNTGEEYNYFLKADERRFIFKSELDVSAPGEPIKVDNRFIGTCKDQMNASAADVLEIEEDQDIVEAIKQHKSNTSSSVDIENDSDYKEQLIVAPKEKKVTSADEISTSSQDVRSKASSVKETRIETTEPTVPEKIVVVEDFQYTHKKAVKVKEKHILKDVERESNTRAINKVEGKSSSPTLSKNNHSATKPASLKTTNDVIDVLVKKKIHSLVLTPKQLAVLPKYQNEKGYLIYFVTGVGKVKITNESLNIRQSPGVSSSKVGTIQNKKSVQVLQYTPSLDGWLYIESEGEKSGWVSETFVDWKPW